MAARKVMVWDLPVRIFHWLLVMSFVMAWLSHESSRYLDVHVFAGYSFFGLLLFRLLWGVFGTHYARFAEFAYGPKEVFVYLKSLLGKGLQSYVGHNPAGAWAIFLLIGFGLVLSVSGLMVLGGEEQQGPLAGVVSFDQGALWMEVHESVALLLLALVCVHVLGVFSESIMHKQNLVGAMFRGTKWVAGESATVPVHHLLGIAIVVALIAWGAVSFGGYLTATADKPYLPFKGPQLAMNDTWQEECGACHLAFHPNLLPARSWQRMFAEQDQHFDEDLMLDEDVVTELTAYAIANAAEQQKTEAAWEMQRTISKDQSPLRITETAYWRDQHHEIQDSVWAQNNIKSKSNCNACHMDADLGTFEDAAMKIPKPSTNPTTNSSKGEMQ